MENIVEQSTSPALDYHAAEVELRYVTSKRGYPYGTVLNSTTSVVDLLRSLWNDNTLELREEFKILLLSHSLRFLGWSRISIGSSTATVVDVRQIVQIALLGNAKSVILAHNHPSGRLTPSRVDMMLTKRVASALKLHDINVVDHIIMTRDDSFSFALHNLQDHLHPSLQQV